MVRDDDPRKSEPPPLLNQGRQINQCCPRCGYGLVGTIRGWQNVCPLESQCPECGLTISWGDLFNGKVLPRWYLEASGGFFRGFLRSPGTFFGIMPVRNTWKRLSLESLAWVFNVRAFLGWMLFLFLVIYFSLGLAVGGSAASDAFDPGFDRKFKNPGSKFSVVARPLKTRKAGLPEYQQWKKALAMQPISYEARTAGILGLLDPFMLVQDAGPRAWFWIKEGEKYGPLDFWRVKKPDPRTYLAGNIRLQSADGLYLLGSMAVLTPLTFLVLPASRKRAKVRFRHILRLALLGLAIPVVYWLLMVLDFAIRQNTDLQTSDLGGLFLPFLMVLAAFGLFWASACRNYLRFSEWRWVPVSLSILMVGFLGGVISMSMIHRMITG